jgi:hypothetical protein
LVIYLFDSFYNRNFQIPLSSFTIASQKKKWFATICCRTKITGRFHACADEEKRKIPAEFGRLLYSPAALVSVLFFIFPPKSGQTTRLFVDIFLDYSFVDWAI